MAGRRDLTDEEKNIWKELTRAVTPLKKSTAKKNTQKPSLEKSPAPLPTKKKTYVPLPIPPVVSQEKKSKPRTVKLGIYADMDKSTAHKFRSGNMKIEARLDLHGMTEGKAHNSFMNFIHRQVELENRNLLVITGKGNGILQDALAKWVMTPELQKLILAFDTARPKHGGSGAYYIRLKKNRN